MTYNKLSWRSNDIEDLHRRKLNKFIEELQKGNGRSDFEKSESVTNPGIIRFPIPRDRKAPSEVEVNPSQWKIRVMTKTDLRRGTRKRALNSFDGTQIINPHEIFKNKYKLSLKDGKFALFENIDQYPLILSNFGMASKVKK
jgi:hypothetical protein